MDPSLNNYCRGVFRFAGSSNLPCEPCVAGVRPCRTVSFRREEAAGRPTRFGDGRESGRPWQFTNSASQGADGVAGSFFPDGTLRPG